MRGIDLEPPNCLANHSAECEADNAIGLGNIGDGNSWNILHCSSVLGLGPRFFGAASRSGQVHSTPLLRHLSQVGFFSSHCRMLEAPSHGIMTLKTDAKP
jgi:hypothetical protein